jgi:hypothetical protein
MTAHDQMTLWSRKRNEELDLSNQGCLFEGVRDLEDDTAMGKAYAETAIPSDNVREYLNPALSPPGDMSSAMDSSGDSSDSDIQSRLKTRTVLKA